MNEAATDGTQGKMIHKKKKLQCTHALNTVRVFGLTKVCMSWYYGNIIKYQ